MIAARAFTNEAEEPEKEAGEKAQKEKKKNKGKGKGKNRWLSVSNHCLPILPL